jgi:hypothetical protein
MSIVAQTPAGPLFRGCHRLRLAFLLMPFATTPGPLLQASSPAIDLKSFIHLIRIHLRGLVQRYAHMDARFEVQCWHRCACAESPIQRDVERARHPVTHKGNVEIHSNEEQRLVLYQLLTIRANYRKPIVTTSQRTTADKSVLCKTRTSFKPND